MKLPNSISVKLIGFLLALCIPPFLLYQVLTFSIVRSTISGMALQHSMDLLADREAYLKHQLDRIEDLLRNISTIDEIKIALSHAADEPVGQQSTASRIPSFRFRTHDELSIQSRISAILNSYGNLAGLVSIDLITYSGQHHRVGDTLDTSNIDQAELERLMQESRQANGKIRWHGIRSNISLTSDQHKVIVASQTLWQTDASGALQKPLGVLLVNYDPLALFRDLNEPRTVRGSKLMVVDDTGNVLYYPDSKLIGLAVSPDIIDLLGAPEGTFAIQLENHPTLMNFRWLPQWNWHIVSLTPENELFAPLRDITRIGSVLLVIALLLVIWPSWLFDQRVIRPIRALSDGFQNFRANRLSDGWRMPQMKSLREINQLIGWFNIFLEKTETQRQAEVDLRVAATAFESQEGVIITDAETNVIRVNRAFSAITGYELHEIQGKPVRTLKSGRQNKSFYQDLWCSIVKTDKWNGEIWNRRKNGELYPAWLAITAVRDPQGQITHYVGAFVDITQRKQAEERIERLAYYDTLTQLPNRHLLLDSVQKACARSSQQDNCGAILLIDLDNFKFLNESQGHKLGDQLLQEISLRLRNQVHEPNAVFRWGGDEFVVLLTQLDPKLATAQADARAIGENLLARLQGPYRVGDDIYRCTSSIGVALFHGQDGDAAELLKHAELAMYAAKASGRNTLRFFDPTMQKTAADYASLASCLHQAVEEQQLELHYQIQVDATGRAVGAEALLRWHRPNKGLVSPAIFIPVAEQSNLIVELGNWALETACQRLVAWSEDPVLSDLTLAVNISARQFREPEFTTQVLGILASTQAPPHRLKLELTESLLIGDTQDTIHKMHVLKDHGIAFSLDDFGTGYSSLSYLRQLPLNQLKIDRSFVNQAGQNSADAAIIETILALARTFGLETIAEGVENEEQRAFLAELGCDAYQGYLFGRPLPEAAFVQLVHQYAAPTGCHATVLEPINSDQP